MQQVSAQDTSATKLILDLNACVPDAPVTVTETNTEVRVAVNRRWDPSGDNKLCLTGLEINLKTPIGDRRVTDEHGGTQMRVEFHSASAPPTSIVGTVADVKGREAFATVTGWLVLSHAEAAAVVPFRLASEVRSRCHREFPLVDRARSNSEEVHMSVITVCAEWVGSCKSLPRCIGPNIRGYQRVMVPLFAAGIYIGGGALVLILLIIVVVLLLRR